MANYLEESAALSNGVRIPLIGLGTWLMDEATASQAVVDAVAAGYRHVDTAQAYGNEAGVGNGLRRCGVPREEVFVTTKVRAETKNPDAVYCSIEESLERLGTDYADLVLIHSPQPWPEFRSERRCFEENALAWGGMEDAYRDGLCRSIGVSNFLRDDLENIFNSCSVRPMVNQVLCHAGNTPKALIDWCVSEGIVVEAYSPIAHGAALGQPAVAEIASSHGVSPAQVCMAYCLQLGLVALPKATGPAHIREDADASFGLSEEEMGRLLNLEKLADYGPDRGFPVFAKG